MTSGRRGGIAEPASGGARSTTAARALDPMPAPALADEPLLHEVVDGIAQAVVVSENRGIIWLNQAAARLLPELAPGSWLPDCSVPPLAAAERGLASAFEGEHRGRRLHGVRRQSRHGHSIWYIRDATEEHARTDALLAERSRAAFLAEASSRLALSLHPRHTIRTATTLPVPYLADAAMLIRRSVPGGRGRARLQWSCFAGTPEGVVTGSGPAELAAGVPGLAEALEGDVADASPWLTGQLADLRFALPAGFGRAATALVVPMTGAGGAAGALVVARRSGRAGFAEREISLVRQYAARAGAALATGDLYGEQVRLAQVLQRGLLPPQLPSVPGAAIVGGYRPAGESLRIGGDFYDAWVTGDSVGFVLGDVCGKGTEAAVLAGRVRQALHALRLVETEPVRLIQLLDKALLSAPDTAGRSQFATVLLGIYTRCADGSICVRLAGGGHPAPLVARPDGTVVPIAVGGMPVGAVSDAEFGSAELRLEPGDLLLGYSDGVTDARGGPGGEMWFGESRLNRALASCTGMPAGAVVDRLLQLVDEWLGGQPHDDIALLALQPTQQAS